MFLTREERLDLIRMMADKGITQTDLAEQMKLTVSAISKCLKGVINLSEENMKKMYEIVNNAPHKQICQRCGRYKCICTK